MSEFESEKARTISPEANERGQQNGPLQANDNPRSTHRTSGSIVTGEVGTPTSPRVRTQFGGRLGREPQTTSQGEIRAMRAKHTITEKVAEGLSDPGESPSLTYKRYTEAAAIVEGRVPDVLETPGESAQTETHPSGEHPLFASTVEPSNVDRTIARREHEATFRAENPDIVTTSPREDMEEPTSRVRPYVTDTIDMDEAKVVHVSDNRGDSEEPASNGKADISEQPTEGDEPPAGTDVPPVGPPPEEPPVTPSPEDEGPSERSISELSTLGRALRDKYLTSDYIKYLTTPNIALRTEDPELGTQALRGVSAYSDYMADYLQRFVESGKITPALASEYMSRWVTEEPHAQQMDTIAAQIRALPDGLTREQIAVELADELTDQQREALATEGMPMADQIRGLTETPLTDEQITALIESQDEPATIESLRESFGEGITEAQEAAINALGFARRVQAMETGDVMSPDIRNVFNRLYSDGLDLLAEERPQMPTEVDSELPSIDVPDEVRGLLNEQDVLTSYKDQFEGLDEIVAVLEDAEPTKPKLVEAINKIPAVQYSEYMDETLREGEALSDEEYDRVADILAVDVPIAAELDDAMVAVISLQEALAANQEVNPVQIVAALKGISEAIKKAFPSEEPTEESSRQSGQE